MPGSSTAPPPGSALGEGETRETLARIFETWANYASFIAEKSGLTEEEARAGFADLSAACRDPDGYVRWDCVVCEVHLEGALES